MDGISYIGPAVREHLLQRFILTSSIDRRGLYWRSEDGVVEPRQDGALFVPENATLSFDTYFNAFFEPPWRKHTALETLTLRVDLTGACTVRVWRRALARRTLVAELTCEDATEISIPAGAHNFRQHGAVSLEITARDEAGATWHGAAWWSDTPPQPVGLALVFCTFNREAQLGAVLGRIAAEPAVCGCITRIYVVNQGLPGRLAIPAALRGKLQAIDQPNFGGAGGFTRGLLAALEADDVSHVVLLDDDIEIEPDSLLRMSAFFGLACSDIVLGGQMLDSLHPTLVFEAGAVVTDRHWSMQPQHHSCDAADPARLEALGHPLGVHYNGWWCCGMPLAVLRRAGLPLPVFIRGDDVELGIRLHNAGVPTVQVPGIAVWHEPFYLRLGGWQLYYETRNMLITGALHLQFKPAAVARRMARQLCMHLLTFRYYSSALLLRGIADFLAGPAALGNPQALHASLGELRKRYPTAVTPRGTVIHKQAEPPKLPRTPLGYLSLLAGTAWQQWWRPTRPSLPKTLPVTHLNWTTMRGMDHIVVETWWDDDRPTFQRSRETFRALAVASLRTLWRLYRHGDAAGKSWRKAFPTLVSVPAWQRYLGLTGGQA